MTPPDLDRRTVLGALAGAGALAAFGPLITACAAGSDTGSPTTPVPPAGSAPSDSTPAAAPGDEVDPDEPVEVATQAFLAGLPLLITRRTMQTFAGLAGVNALLHSPGLSNPRSRLVVAPNHDTTYVIGVLDLTAGPLVLGLPPIPDRYHVVQLLDAWMGGFGLVGTRTTGGSGGTYVLARTGWTGATPDGAEVLECPTAHAFLLGRIRAVDDADAEAAVALGREMTLTALDPGAPPIPRDALGAPAGPPQDAGTEGAAVFDELGDALAADPPVTPEQQQVLDAAAGLGIGAGRHPSGDAAVADILDEAAARGLARLEELQGEGARRVNGWDVNLGLGTAATTGGVEGRAAIARWFWGPVPAEEAVYPRLAVADDGQPLDGSKRYRLRFAGDALPPVDAFWSVTAYGEGNFLVPNEANRYSVSGDTPGLVRGADGSIEVLLQHDPPAGSEANWLPLPEGPVTVILRLYLPRRAVVDGSWSPPPVTVV